MCGGTHGCRPTIDYFVGQGPFALPGSAGKLGSGRCRHRPLRKRISGCVGEGLCPSRGRGNRRSAAGGRRSEAVSRKCPDWRPQQWPGIGWDDGGQENPAPTERLQEVRGKNPPDTAAPCQPPSGKGALGTGGRGCPCCGGQNFCAALRRTLEILTAATRSPCLFCRRRRFGDFPAAR